MEGNCPTCGRSTKPTSYKLNSGHISALFKLREAIRYYKKNSIHITNEMFCAKGSPFELNKSEWTNFSYLRYHALAVHHEGHKGKWLLTSRGADFLNGKIVINEIALARGGHVVERTGRLVRVDNYRRRLPKEFFEQPVRVSDPEPIPLPLG